MSLTLKIRLVRTNQDKVMKFAPTMSVSEACAQIMEKTSEGGEDHGLFQPGMEGKRPPRWLRNDRTLQYYDLKLNDMLEFKKKHRPIKVRLMDDTVKTVLIDDSLTVGEIVELIGKKMSIKNSEEFSLQVDGVGEWLNVNQPLHEQGVTDDQQVVLKKKFFVDDANISRDDPVQLHLVYVQSRDAIVSGTHPCTYDESIQFAALQCQVQLGNHNPAIHKPGYLKIKEFLAPGAAKNKSSEKDIYNEFRKLVGMSEVNAKYRYVQLCRSLKTYGLTIFHTKERAKGQKKPVPKLLGITRDAILRLDAETKEVEHEYPLTHLRRWAASPASFTLDFGDYEEEYVSVITNEGEAISQLLSGYIDILLKKRKDTGVVLDGNDNDVANVETVGRVRGQAGTAVTSSSQGGFDSGSGREGQYSAGASAMARKGTNAPQNLNVNNIDTAQTAIANMVLEMDATPLPVPGAMSHLTPQQWRQQLQQHCKAVAAAAGKLGSIGAQPNNIDRSAMNNVAKELYMTIDNMIQSARNASAAEGEDPDGEMPLMDGAKAVADAIARVLKATKDMANKPDQQSIEKFKNAQDLLGAAMNFLNGAVSGNLADLGTTSLIAESAKAIAAATNDLIGATRENMGDLDKTSQNRLAAVANAAENTSQNCLAVAQTLAAAVLDANCKKMIVDSARAVQSQNAALLAAARQFGLDPESLGLNDAARAVSDAIAQLLGVTEIAEPRGGSDPEFAEAARIINNNVGLLMGSKGKPDAMNQAARAINEALPGLVAGAKKAAQKTDDEGMKQRLLAMAKAIADATKGLVDAVATASAAPNDQAAFNKMQEAAKKVALLAQQLTGDAGKAAALQQLRTNAKHAAAATTSLVAAARSAAPTMGEHPQESQALAAAAAAAADAIQKLIKPLQDAQKNPDSPEVFNALLDAAKKTAPVGYKLVAAAKQASPAIPANYRTKKENLAVSANAAAEALKNLNASASGVAAGDENFDNALEQLQGMIADLESEVFEAQSGTLAPSGQSKEEAVEFMNVAVKALGNAAKNLVVSAKTDPDALGPKSQDLASAVQQVVNSSKSVAGSVPNKSTQKAVLNAAKEVASQSESLVGTARALSSNPRDPALSGALTSSAKGVADTIATLIQATKNADPVGKDLDEAIATINQGTGLLNPSPVNTGGDYPTNVEKLTQSAKALSAATSQIINTANSNPAGLGGVAKTTAAIIPDLVERANKAAGSAPNKQDGVAIVAATKAVSNDLVKLLNAARNKQQGNDPKFTQAAKQIADSIKGLLAKLENASPAQREVAAALEAAREAVARLAQPSMKNVPNALDQITQAAKALAESAAAIVSSRDAPEKIGQSATKAAGSLDKMVDAAKAAAVAASGQSNEGLEALAKKVEDTCAQMATASNQATLDENAKKAIIAAAKNAALATSALVGAARSSAVALKPTDPEGSKALLNSAQAVANVTSKLVNLAKSAAAGKPAPKAETAKVTKDLADGIYQLLQHAGDVPASAASSVDLESLSPASQNLVAATQAVGNATVQLMEASHKAAGGNKDNATFTSMSTAAKGVTNAIQAVVNAANGLKPGQKELEEAIEAVQAATVELDSAALNAAIGLLENSAPHGTTLQKAQEDVVEVTKELANAIKDIVTAAKADPAKLGDAAKHTAAIVPRFAMAAKSCAGLTSDNAHQQEQLANAKNLADSLLELLVAAKAGNMNDLSLHAKNASQAITNVISPIKPGVLGSKDCDDAIAQVREQLNALGKPPGKATKTYAECQQEMANVSKALVSALNTLTTSAKSKPEDVGVASKKVAAVIPELVELTRLAAAAVSDAESKKALNDNTKNVINATANIINDAKLVAADRKNAALAAQLGNSFKTVTAAIGQYVATLKAAPASERDVDVALEEIAKVMADLDSAALFAAAGQLEADVSGQSLESCQNALLEASKAISEACANLAKASKGTPEQLGAASKNLAKALSNLARLTKTTACLAGDSVSQQSLLTSARAVSISGQQLVIAARQAQKSGNPADQTSLGASATAVSESVSQLIGFAQAASADASKGIVELDNAASEIRKLLGAFDDPRFKGNEKATAEDVVTAAKQVAESTALLVSACNNNPEDIYQAAKSTSQSTKLLLENSKGAAGLTDDQVIQQNLKESAKAVANATAKLVGAAKAQRSDAGNPAAQQKLSAVSSEVIDKINEVVAVAGDLPGGERAKKLFATAENLEEIAEKELLAAASVIEEATRVLLQAKQRAQEKREQQGLDVTGIDEAILEAARAIAQATAVLVSAATQAQKEIVVAGKSSKTGNVYRRDPTWARGLISAAQSVAGSVQSLVGNANQASQGQAEEEQLVASARGVAAATARLVSASRAKADPNSATQQKLSAAAKSVASATSDLVAAAKVAGEFQEQHQEPMDLSNLSATGAKVQEMEQQVKILKLQKELENAQKRLFSIRKAEYEEETGVPAPASGAKRPAAPASLGPKPAGKPAPKPAGAPAQPGAAPLKRSGELPTPPGASPKKAAAPGENPAPAPALKKPAPVGLKKPAPPSSPSAGTR